MADNDKITELANRIYALDEKVYKATGSNLGRVYQGNKEKCINDLRDLLKSSADSSVLRSELALISNMARTTKKNPQLHKEIMHEYGEIFDKQWLCRKREREMIGIFGTKEPDAAWERRVLQRYPILRGSVKYIQIEELPRTMNGKLDYKKLQEYI